MPVPIYPLNEHIIDSAVYKLEENLDTAIAAVNAADTKGVTLTVPSAAQIFDYMPIPKEVVDYPYIGFQEAEGEWINDVGDSATGEWQFIVACFDIDPEPWRLRLKLMRMRQAVVSTLMQGRQLSHPTNAILGAWGLTFMGTKPGPTLGITESPREWVSWTSMLFLAKAEDDPS